MGLLSEPSGNALNVCIMNIVLSIIATTIVLSNCGERIDSEVSPEMLTQVTEWTVSGVEFDNSDFSGLAFCADGKRMVAAFNSAALYWLEIPEEGKELAFTPLDVPGARFREIKRDIEAVTVNHGTGDIFYVQERASADFAGASIYKLAAPAFDKQELVVSFDHQIVPENNIGLEGISWVGGDNFVVGREGTVADLKPMIIFYSCKDGITKSVTPASEIKQIAELVYDDKRDCLWILDGDYDRMLYRCDLDGNILDRYPVPFIRNAEALLLDRSRNCIWIGSDEVPSKLYKISFRNL